MARSAENLDSLATKYITESWNFGDLVARSLHFSITVQEIVWDPQYTSD
jgi:hypothetical protein